MEVEIVNSMIDLLEKEQSISIGNDIVYLPGFEKTFNLLFRNKSYTDKEIEYCEQFSNPLLRYASTWAAKEASYKAIKQIDSSISLFWNNIEIIREKVAGKPIVQTKNSEIGSKIRLSISHDGEYVWAIALLKSL